MSNRALCRQPRDWGFDGSSCVPITQFDFDHFEVESGYRPAFTAHQDHAVIDHPETDEGKALREREERLLEFLPKLLLWQARDGTGTAGGAKLRLFTLLFFFDQEAMHLNQRQFAELHGMSKQNFGRSVSEFRDWYHAQFPHLAELRDPRLYSAGARGSAKRRERRKRKLRKLDAEQ